jgi:hypothetical protein
MGKTIKWTQGNIKLPERIIHMSLPSGYTCPMALKCLAKADANTGKITDGKEQEYRCYAAMQEARHSGLRKNRWSNYTILKKLSKHQMFLKLSSSLSNIHDKYITNHNQHPIIRAHIGGDFFNENYFLAWLQLASHYHPTQFYSYTKRTDLWVKNIKDIPINFIFNASRGGKRDDLIDTHNLKCAEVVYSHQQAVEKGLEIDHDDSHAYSGSASFAQLIHGCQKAGSDASKALSNLKKETGWTGYNKSTKTKTKTNRTVLLRSNKP